MAPAITTDVVGLLVAVTASDYSFKNERGDTVAGTSHRAWLSTSFDSTPVEVTVPADSDHLKSLGLYTEPVRLHMRLEPVGKKKGNSAQVGYRLVDMQEAPAESLPARGAKAS